jgi:putative oxidoreductase
MFDNAGAAPERNALTDWVLRGGIALVFLLFGWEKFDSHSEWPSMFAQIGLGQWFRYFTGVVEMAGAAFLLVPWTVNAGLTVLSCTMAGAALIHIFVLHHPFNCVIPGALCAGLTAFLISRRRR